VDERDAELNRNPAPLAGGTGPKESLLFAMKDLSQLNCVVNDGFENWQAEYAAHRIATFPIGPNKIPLVKHHSRFGLVGSAKIARRFADASAIGFMGGPRSGITVLDVDTNDERVFADALNRHGPTPVVVRTGSGNLAWGLCAARLSQEAGAVQSRSTGALQRAQGGERAEQHILYR
jgi:hypothetical protein